jgi:hypothetical protein
MPNRVNPAVERMQAPDANAVANPVLVQSRLTQLPHRDHPVLHPRDSSDNQVRCGASVVHTATKAPRTESLPPPAEGVGNPNLIR